MNKKERVDAALRGDQVDRIPASMWGHDFEREWSAQTLAEAMVENFTRYVSVRSSDSSAYYLLSQAYRALGKKDQMNQALQQFEKTSQDVKARSKAQARLQALNRQGEVTDEAREVEPKQIH